MNYVEQDSFSMYAVQTWAKELHPYDGTTPPEAVIL